MAERRRPTGQHSGRHGFNWFCRPIAAAAAAAAAAAEEEEEEEEDKARKAVQLIWLSGETTGGTWSPRSEQSRLPSLSAVAAALGNESIRK